MNLGLNASQLQFLAEVVVQPLKQAGATVYLFGSRARGTAAPALLTKAREHLQQGELKAAAELYQQIALDDHLWPERLTDTIRYHLLNKRPLEAWRLTELARRVGTHLDDLSYYRALTGCTKTPDMSEVLSHLGGCRDDVRPLLCCGCG